MPKRKRANKAKHAGQVEREWDDRRRSYITGTNDYVFVCNVLGDTRDWPRVGNTFKRVEVIGARYNQSNKLPGGFREGDCFVEFGSGQTMLICEKEEEEFKRYTIREATAQERLVHAKSFRLVERDLRWRRGSYVMQRETA